MNAERVKWKNGKILEENNRIYKQTLDKDLSIVYSFYSVRIVANMAYNNTRINQPMGQD